MAAKYQVPHTTVTSVLVEGRGGLRLGEQSVEYVRGDPSGVRG